jgi:hypothetical protein
LAAQQLSWDWQSGSQWGTAVGRSQQSQVPPGTDGFATKAPFTSYAWTQPQQPQQNFGSIEQQFGSMSISGIQHPQKLQSSHVQQQCTESQWTQPFTGVQQPQQQLETLAKQHQQQFEEFINPQQQHQSFGVPRYSQQQPFAWAQPSQQQLQQPQQSQPRQITGAQQQFEPFKPRQHLHSFATAQPPRQQHFAQMPQPLQQSFGTVHSQGQFNVTQQPQRLLLTGNQQQFKSAQQPQQQLRNYSGSHQPIQQALPPHQQHPVNINPFTVSYII